MRNQTLNAQRLNFNVQRRTPNDHFCLAKSLDAHCMTQGDECCRQVAGLAAVDAISW
jgi:hypothetical protein